MGALAQALSEAPALQFLGIGLPAMLIWNWWRGARPDLSGMGWYGILIIVFFHVSAEAYRFMPDMESAVQSFIVALACTGLFLARAFRRLWLPMTMIVLVVAAPAYFTPLDQPFIIRLGWTQTMALILVLSITILVTMDRNDSKAMYVWIIMVCAAGIGVIEQLSCNILYMPNRPFQDSACSQAWSTEAINYVLYAILFAALMIMWWRERRT